MKNNLPMIVPGDKKITLDMLATLYRDCDRSGEPASLLTIPSHVEMTDEQYREYCSLLSPMVTEQLRTTNRNPTYRGLEIHIIE